MGSLCFVGCPMLPAIVNLNQSEKLKGSYLKIKETKCYSSLQCKTIKILPTNIKLQTVKSVHFKVMNGLQYHISVITSQQFGLPFTTLQYANFHLDLMLLACHKKSYLICVEFSNFRNITQYLFIFKQLSLPCWLSQFCKLKKKSK